MRRLISIFVVGIALLTNVMAQESIPEEVFYTTIRIRAYSNLGRVQYGSGVALDMAKYKIGKKRYILTAAHLFFFEGPKKAKTISMVEEIEIRGPNGAKKWTPSSLICFNEAADLALIEVFEDLPYVATLSPEELKVPGSPITVIGCPAGMSPAATQGFLSDYKPEDSPYAQASATFFFGNSGGPIFNQKWEVIGIAVAGLTLPPPDQGMAPNICMYVPIPKIEKFMQSDVKDALKKNKKGKE